MRPHIEYHFNVFHHGRWCGHHESHLVGTTFAAVAANGWAWAEKVVPMRLRWTSHVWPGGYEVHYITEDEGVLCHRCANAHLDLTLDDDAQWRIVAEDINYEHPHMTCDHCGVRIGPECGEDSDD